MSNVNNPQSSDKITNLLKWAAFGTIGLYLWRVNKVKGRALGSTNPNNLKLDIDTDKLVDSAANLFPGSSNKKEITILAAKEFIKNYKKERQNV